MITFIESTLEKNFKNMGTNKITVSHKRRDCIGCGFCSMAAPNNWQMNREDGQSDLKGSKEKGDYMVGEIEQDQLEENIAAQDLCPVQIIKVNKKIN